jgi:excisionase family DNA binding protein
MDQDWITIKEAATLTGYNAEYIRCMINEGKITAKKFSFVWAIDKDSLLAYIQQGKDSGDPRAGPKGPRPKTTTL